MTTVFLVHHVNLISSQVLIYSCLSNVVLSGNNLIGIQHLKLVLWSLLWLQMTVYVSVVHMYTHIINPINANNW